MVLLRIFDIKLKVFSAHKEVQPLINSQLSIFLFYMKTLEASNYYPRELNKSLVLFKKNNQLHVTTILARIPEKPNLTFNQQIYSLPNPKPLENFIM